MASKLIIVICFVHFLAAAVLGAMADAAWKGRFESTPTAWAVLAGALVVNTVLFRVFLGQWRRRNDTEAIEPSADLKVVDVAVHGLPVNLRIRLLLNAIAWIAGIVVPIAFAIE